MARFPSEQIHQDCRRSLREVRHSFGRIVARMQGLARNSQGWLATRNDTEKTQGGPGDRRTAPGRPAALLPVARLIEQPALG
ncbi:MAG: hypothetical protein HY303_16560 [Candidatus Wallbacteria bacterium]|nr:hypothetical protein [Candidatus Wallbacteria bacterium]